MLSEEGWEGNVNRITTLVKAEIDSLKQELNCRDMQITPFVEGEKACLGICSLMGILELLFADSSKTLLDSWLICD